MKKLTLEQALKTPNIAFNVTPKQVNEFNHITKNKFPEECVAIRIVNTFNINYTSEFSDCYNEFYLPILVEIIEKESNTFNSQQEVWQWLVEGNKCIWNNKPIQFINGILIREGDVWCTTVYNYTEFTKYKEPEFITVNGFQVPKPIKELSEFKLANLLIEEGIHSNEENAYIHAQAMLGYMEA